MDSKPTNTAKTVGSAKEDPRLIGKNNSVSRIVMRLETSSYLNRLEANQFSVFTQKFHKSVSKTLNHFEGNVVKKDNNTYLVLFMSVTNAILCALKIQANFKYITPRFDTDNRRIKIAISAVETVSAGDEFLTETATVVSRMCEVVQGQLVISSAVKTAYEHENKNAQIDRELIRTMGPGEERFLDQLMEYSEKMWNKPDFNVRTMSSEMGLSTSQLYRRLIKLTGKSSNTFIREFRLQRALNLLHGKFGNVSEIAFESGFRSPSYFSKCFMDKFGILPSTYVRQHVP